MRTANICMCLQRTRRHQFFLVFALLPALLALTSCGGGSSSSTTTTTPTITVSCVPTQVSVSGKSVCTPTPNGLTSTLVNWEAGGVAGGNSTFGTIDANGNYVAPQNVPTNNVVTITAVSQSQSSVTGTANVTILPSTKISSVVCLDPNSQASLTAASGSSLACTAESSTGSPISVFWQVDTIQGGNPVIGTMTPQGNYVAPLIPPAGGTVTITAVSQADSTQTMTVNVTVTFGNRVLRGPYAFSTSGIFTAAGFFARAGSFTADGNGNLVNGNEDINPPGGNATTVPIPFTGIYSVGPDGRGIMQFCEHTTLPCSAPGVNFRIVVLSPQRVQIVQFEAGATANGEMVSQDISAFNDIGLFGTYTFSFSGISSGTTTESAVGEFVANGNGRITSGEIDINNGGAPSQLSIQNTSTYSVTAAGWGTATIVTASKTFVFRVYMISASAATFIEQDASPVLAGDAFKQQFGGTLGNSILSGTMVFGTAGSGPSGGIADLASFTADGAGGITTGSGTLDQNSGGVVAPALTFGGAGSIYAIDPVGRGTLNIPGHTYVFYMIAESPAAAAVIQETTAGFVGHGSMIQPQGGSTLKGSYAFDLNGLVGVNEEDAVGQLSADGKGAITNTAANPSTLDVNNFGVLLAAQGNAGTVGTSNGRVTMSLTSATTPSVTRNFVMYFVSPTTVVALGTDGTGPATATLTNQF